MNVLPGARIAGAAQQLLEHLNVGLLIVDDQDFAVENVG